MPGSSASSTRASSRASGERSSSTSDCSSTPPGGPVTYRDVITYPAVRQDIAVAVAEDVPVGDLVAAAREAAGDELREIRVFDVYRGDQVGPGRKSVAFSVAYQAPDRTLDRRGRGEAAERDRRHARRALRRRVAGLSYADPGGAATKVIVRADAMNVGLNLPLAPAGAV